LYIIDIKIATENATKYKQKIKIPQHTNNTTICQINKNYKIYTSI